MAAVARSEETIASFRERLPDGLGIVGDAAAADDVEHAFAETRKRLPRYGQFAADTESRIGNRTVDNGAAFRESELAHLGQDAANLLREAQTIRKLLDDPRFAAVKDAQVVAERAELEQLDAMQQARAAALSEFVQRESAGLADRRYGMEGFGAIGSKKPDFKRGPDPTPQPIPLPSVSAPAGMPLLSGIEVVDRGRLGEWGESIATAVRRSENEAARTFLPIAQACR